VLLGDVLCVVVKLLAMSADSTAALFVCLSNCACPVSSREALFASTGAKRLQRNSLTSMNMYLAHVCRHCPGMVV